MRSAGALSFRAAQGTSSGMNSREILRLLKMDGWYEVDHGGSHVQLKHADRPGRTTVPHPRADLPLGTLKSIEKQSGVQLRPR